MRVAGAAGEVEEDTHHPPTQGLGRFKPVGGLKQLGQVVEADGDIRVLRAVALLIDFERP
jgi:hypothetical protein